MKDRRGNSALHRAVMTKNAQSVKFLIDCGASIDEVNTDGQTPMGMAIKDPELTIIFFKERSGAAMVHSLS
jgi:ankyrin repeat protein